MNTFDDLLSTSIAIMMHHQYCIGDYYSWWYDSIIGLMLKKWRCEENDEVLIARWDSLSLYYISRYWLNFDRKLKVELRLNNNNFSKFPTELLHREYIESLSEIDFSHNKLKKVPKRLFELEYLEYLDLSHNMLQQIPNNIVWRDSLKTLNLNNNKLLDLPLCFSKRCYLRILKLSSNFLTTLPVSIGEMPMLVELYISKNKKMYYLPNELGKLKLVVLELKDMDQV